MKEREVNSGQLTIRVREHKRERWLVLVGELDFAGVEALEETLAEAMGSRAMRVVVDLSGLEFIDSTGMRTLYVALQNSQERDNVLGFIRGPDEIMHALELTGLADEFPFLD